MSRVTVVPALRAARQMVRAFSSAILWPLGAEERLADRATLDRDLGAAGQAARGELPEEVEVRRHGGVGLLGVEGVLAEEVEGDRAVRRRPARRRLDGGLAWSRRGRSCATIPAETGIVLTSFLTVSLRARSRSGCAEQRHAPCIVRAIRPRGVPRTAQASALRRYAGAAWQRRGARPATAKPATTPRSRQTSAVPVDAGQLLHRVHGVGQRQHVADRLEHVGAARRAARTGRRAGSAGSRRAA